MRTYAVGGGRAGPKRGCVHFRPTGSDASPGLWGANPSFEDECFEFSDFGCQEQQLLHCPDGQQNSRAELMKLFGAAQ